MSLPGPSSHETRTVISRWYTVVEDIVYIGLGLLLTGIAALLLVSEFIGFGRSVLGWTIGTSIIGLLDHILLILLIAELLYTVKVSFREHSLVPEPILLVGLISVIRRVLVLTAELGEKHERAQSINRISIIELAVLGGLILVLAISLVLLKRPLVRAERD